MHILLPLLAGSNDQQFSCCKGIFYCPAALVLLVVQFQIVYSQISNPLLEGGLINIFEVM